MHPVVDPDYRVCLRGLHVLEKHNVTFSQVKKKAVLIIGHIRAVHIIRK